MYLSPGNPNNSTPWAQISFQGKFSTEVWPQLMGIGWANSGSCKVSFLDVLITLVCGGKASVVQYIIYYAKSIAKTLTIAYAVQGVPGIILFPQFKVFWTDWVGGQLFMVVFVYHLLEYIVSGHLVDINPREPDSTCQTNGSHWPCDLDEFLVLFDQLLNFSNVR